MKKLLIVAAMLLSASVGYAQQVVTVLWPFNIASNQANFARAVLDQANTQQTKYRFVLQNKPGAGGTIASRMVLEDPGLTLMSSSSSFFVRPVFFPNESYDTNKFKPVLIQCTGQPLALVSAKYKTVSDLKRQKRVTVGIVNGSLTEGVARELARQLTGVEVDFIPYQGTLQATQDVIGERLDVSVDFAGDVIQWVEASKVNVIGITGTNSYPSFTSFAKQGVTGFDDLVSNYQFVAPQALPQSQTEELHLILSQAAKTSALAKDLYKRDFCNAADLSMEQTNAVFNKWKTYWPKQLGSK